MVVVVVVLEIRTNVDITHLTYSKLSLQYVVILTDLAAVILKCFARWHSCKQFGLMCAECRNKTMELLMLLLLLV